MGNAAPEPQALLEWFKDLAARPAITKFEQLADGLILWKALQHFDSDHFKSDLPSSDTNQLEFWVPRWQNLKYVHKSLVSFIRDNCEHRPSITTTPDLKAIAEGGKSAEAETSELLKVVLAATVFSDKAPEYLARVQKLDQSIQLALMGCIQEMQMAELGPAEEEESPKYDPSAKPTTQRDNQPPKDRDFEYEATTARLVAEIRQAQQEGKDAREEADKLTERLARLSKGNEELQEELRKAESSLEAYASDEGGSAAKDKTIDSLETKILDLEYRLQSRETELKDASTNLKILESKADQFEKGSNELQELKDEVDVMKSEKEKLTKKANTADHYRQKAQAAQSIEAEVKYLREENAKMSKSGELQKTVEAIKRELRETKYALSMTEQNHQDILESKKRAEHENSLLKEKYEIALSKQTTDQDTIQDLSEKMKEYESNICGAGGSLEHELKSGDESRAGISSRNLTNDSSDSIDVTSTSVYRSEIELKYENLQNQYAIVYQEKNALQRQLQALSTGDVAAGSAPYLTLQDKVDKLNLRVRELEEMIQNLENEKRIIGGALNQASLDLQLVGKSDLEVLAKLKTENSKALVAVQAERDDLREQLTKARSSSDTHQSLFTLSVNEKQGLSRELLSSRHSEGELAKANITLKATLDVLRGANEHYNEGAGRALEQQTIKLQDKVENTREKLAKKTEVMEELHFVKLRTSGADIRPPEALRSNRFHKLYSKNLQNQLSNLRDEGKTAISQQQEEEEAHSKVGLESLGRLAETETEQEQSVQDERYANLLRENALLTTAWYDVTSRLQLKDVVLHRRNEAPRSFLNKQRQALNAKPYLGGFMKSWIRWE
ncbi:MAG: hypothetical protein M1814_005810 [Vezdaea aestivalis]|nr:MAG: hypothetical protein M1814_005810 [Vezdaea aestivalis]